MRFRALSYLFDWEKINKEGKEFIADMSSRHDIPQGKNIPKHLQDKIGTWQVSRSGYPVPGQVLTDDVSIGSRSPALPIYIGLYSLIAVLAGLLPQLGLGFLFPIIAALYFIGFVSFFGFLATIGFAFLTVGSLALIPYVAGPLSMVGISASTIASVLGLVPAFLPLLYLYKVTDTRASQLAHQAHEFGHSAVNAPKTGRNEARWIQAIDAIKDKTKFIRYGTAMGALSFNGDSFAPDPGLPFGQTTNDMSTHVAVFGETGAGKTTQLRTIMKQIVEDPSNGVFLLDGKGFLANDCRKMLNHVIDHTYKMNPQEGLDAEQFAKTLQEQNAPVGGETGNGKYFSDQARNICFTTGIFQRILVKHKLAPFHLTKFKEIVEQLFSKEDNGLSDLLKLIPIAEQSGKLFEDAVKHYMSLHSQEGEAFQGIKSSVEAWLAPFFQSEKLRHWCDCEVSDIDVTNVLKGDRIGVCLPKKQFPIAGKVVTGLMKAKFYSAMALRGDKWQEAGGSHAFLIIDEAHEVTESLDATMVPLGRTMGLTCIFATQNIEAYITKLGENPTKEMMNSFISIICLRSSDGTYNYIRNRIGKDRVWIEKVDGAKLAYGLTTKVTLSHAIFDPNNPYRFFMRQYGFGIIRKMIDKLGHKKLTDQGKGGVGSRFATMQLSPEPIFILQEKDIQIIQNEPFTAIATVKNAGVPRRDIIKLLPLDIDFKSIPTTSAEKMAAGKVNFGDPYDSI